MKRDIAVGVGWHYENQLDCSSGRSKMFYRMYNPMRVIITTLNANERDSIRSGWRYEGVSWKSSGQHPLYRLYNLMQKLVSHRILALRREGLFGSNGIAL